MPTASTESLSPACDALCSSLAFSPPAASAAAGAASGGFATSDAGSIAADIFELRLFWSLLGSRVNSALPPTEIQTAGRRKAIGRKRAGLAVSRAEVRHLQIVATGPQAGTGKGSCAMSGCAAETAMKQEVPQCLHSLVKVICEAEAIDLASVSTQSPAELLEKTVRRLEGGHCP